MYEPLKQETDIDTEHVSIPTTWNGKGRSNKQRSVVVALSISLITALMFNLALVLRMRGMDIKDKPSPYVGLVQNIPTAIPHDNRPIDDPFWDEDPVLDTFSGWIALDSEYIREHNLLSSMRWPWDQNKHIYVLHAYHSLHCVKVLRTHVMELTAGKETTWAVEHVGHCLHVLREDVMCNADDTPRYTGSLHTQKNFAANRVSSGTGQVKMCKDFNKLHAFGVEHSACYQRNFSHEEPLLDRYKHCPDGSQPWLKLDGTEEGIKS